MGSVGSSNDLFNKYHDTLESYVFGDTLYINHELRNKDIEDIMKDPTDKELINSLDNALSQKLNYDGTLYRSVDLTSLGLNGDEAKQVFNAIVSDDGSAKDKIDKILNTTYTEKGYMSTTTSQDVANELGDYTAGVNGGSGIYVVLNITPNSNTKGLDVSRFDKEYSDDEPQKERLLARDQQYKVTRLYKRGGRLYADTVLL